MFLSQMPSQTIEYIPGYIGSQNNLEFPNNTESQYHTGSGMFWFQYTQIWKKPTKNFLLLHTPSYFLYLKSQCPKDSHINW